MPAPTFTYWVEVRDKTGTLIDILRREITDIAWSYEALGGCAEAQISLRREFDNFGDLARDYDIQIYRVPSTLMKPGDRLDAQLPMLLAGDVGAKELRWRGFIRGLQPVFDERESVRLQCSGYSRQLEYIVVPAQTYATQDVGAAARSIIDTYVTPGSQILRTAGLSLVQDQGVTISSTGLTFDTTAMEAIRTLAEIGGNAEWGVGPDLEFYFLARSATVKQTWIIGDRIKFFQTETTTDEEVRKVYLRGAGAFTATLTSALGLEAGRYKERVALVPSVAAAADATLWGTAYFSRFETAQEKARLTLSSTDKWIENRADIGQVQPPLGRLRVQGGPSYARAGAQLPAQFIGSGISLLTTVGGTTYKDYRIATIFYRPVGNALQVEIELGEKKSTLADYLRGLEFKLSELRQAV